MSDAFPTLTESMATGQKKGSQAAVTGANGSLRRHRSTSHCNASAYDILADAPRLAVARVALAPYTSGRHGRLPNVPRMSRAETTPPQQAGAPARVSRQGGGRFGRQLLALAQGRISCYIRGKAGIV